MTDDELFASLAKAHRAQDPLRDPRLDALVQGKLPEAERDALKAEAERSDDLRAAYQALTPLDEHERDRIVDQILAAGPKAPVIPLAAARQPRMRRAAPIVGVVFAAAAAFALLFRAPDRAALPAYEASLAGERLERALGPDQDTARRLGPGSSIDLVLRPATAVKEPVGARAFLVREGHARPWDAPIQVSEDGAIRVAGSFDAILGKEPPGPCEIVFLIQRATDLSSSPETIEDAIRDPGRLPPGSRLVRVAVQVVDRR